MSHTTSHPDRSSTRQPIPVYKLNDFLLSAFYSFLFSLLSITYRRGIFRRDATTSPTSAPETLKEPHPGPAEDGGPQFDIDKERTGDGGEERNSSPLGRHYRTRGRSLSVSMSKTVNYIATCGSTREMEAERVEKLI